MIQTFDNTGTIGEIYSRLRDSFDRPVVYAERGLGKTTALLHYIAGQYLANLKTPVLLCPNFTMAQYAKNNYKELFPTLPLSTAHPKNLRSLIDGQLDKIVIYIDEFSWLSEEDNKILRSYKDYIKAGVSSPIQARIYTVSLESIL